MIKLQPILEELRGLDKLISKETGLPIKIAENPLLCVVLGAGKVLENIEFHNALYSEKRTPFNIKK